MALSLLVIDDDNDLLDAIKMVLELDGFRITIAHNGIEALSLLEQKIKFDAVLLDLTMPGMSGLEFLEIFNGRQFNLPVIVITAAGKPMLDHPLLKGVQLLRKPFPVDDLLDALAQIPAEVEAVSQQPRRGNEYSAGFHDPYI